MVLREVDCVDGQRQQFVVVVHGGGGMCVWVCSGVLGATGRKKREEIREDKRCLEMIRGVPEK